MSNEQKTEILPLDTNSASIFDMSNFQLVPESIFENVASGWDLSYINDQRSKNNINICKNCNVAMQYSTNSQYECPVCFVNIDIIGDVKDTSEETSRGVLKITSSHSSRSLYTSVPNYAKTQKKQILDQLTAYNEMYTGVKISRDIIIATANQYNEIQKLTIDEVKDDGETSTQRKFVKRGDIRSEIIGACLYYECQRAGSPLKKKDIAAFMKLGSNGISRGENVVRVLHLKNKINIPINYESNEDLIIRYLDALNLYELDQTGELTKQTSNFVNFVADLVNMADLKHFGTASISSSKISGAIYILIQKMNLDIKNEAICKACDNIRVTTFSKFSKIILDEKNILSFISVFEKNNIPHGCRIKKKIKQPSTL